MKQRRERSRVGSIPSSKSARLKGNAKNTSETLALAVEATRQSNWVKRERQTHAIAARSEGSSRVVEAIVKREAKEGA